MMDFSDNDLPENCFHNTGRHAYEDEELEDDVEMFSQDEEEIDSEGEEEIIEETDKQKLSRIKYELQKLEDSKKRREYIDIKKLEDIINSGEYDGKYSTDKIKQSECIPSTIKRVLENANKRQIYTKSRNHNETCSRDYNSSSAGNFAP